MVPSGSASPVAELLEAVLDRMLGGAEASGRNNGILAFTDEDETGAGYGAATGPIVIGSVARLHVVAATVVLGDNVRENLDPLWDALAEFLGGLVDLGGIIGKIDVLESHVVRGEEALEGKGCRLGFSLGGRAVNHGENLLELGINGVHGVSPFGFAGRHSFRLLAYSIVEYGAGCKISHGK